MFNLKEFVSRLFGRGLASEKKTPEFADGTTPWLVIGLGNPGAKYEATPHNVGYMAIDEMLKRTGTTLQPLPGMRAHAAATDIAGQPALLVRSTTYMNDSGEAVLDLATHYGIPLDKIVVLHDELDLPHGKVRVKQGGNENGHNGLKSTTAEMGSRDYLRVRMGIGRPAQGATVIDHVLGPIQTGEKLDSMVQTSADAVEEILAGGLQKAQHTIHSRNSRT